ncbi:hypothetical protein K474DRAFT_198174 [Panus rudis PR-1116 ss-1]|nr:hypothetical protein K474DRAFT_198174 [Panus rudis PR-1116 ss-1]
MTSCTDIKTKYILYENTQIPLLPDANSPQSNLTQGQQNIRNNGRHVGLPSASPLTLHPHPRSQRVGSRRDQKHLSEFDLVRKAQVQALVNAGCVMLPGLSSSGSRRRMQNQHSHVLQRTVAYTKLVLRRRINQRRLFLRHPMLLFDVCLDHPTYRAATPEGRAKGQDSNLDVGGFC